MQTHVILPLIIIHEYTLTSFTSYVVHCVPTQQVQCALWLNTSNMHNNRPMKISYANCHVVVDVVTTHMWSCALHGSNLLLHTISSVAVTNHIRFSNLRGQRRNFLSWLCSELSAGACSLARAAERIFTRWSAVWPAAGRRVFGLTRFRQWIRTWEWTLSYIVKAQKHDLSKNQSAVTFQTLYVTVAMVTPIL